jgi:hypothetical protein
VADCAYEQLKSALKASSAARMTAFGAWGFRASSRGRAAAAALVAVQFQGNSSARRERGQPLEIRSITSTR